MKPAISFAAALVLGVLTMPSVSHAAVNCTLNGNMTIEPQDRYYCDNNHQTCSGWLQQDLDLKTGASAPPLRFLRLTFWNSAGTRLATTYTNASGAFSAVVSLPGASCTGQNVRVQREFVRIHEADLLSANPRARFRIAEHTAARNTQADYQTVPLTGATTNAGYRQRQSDTTSEGSHFANVFYTLDSAIQEISNWSTTLSTRLTYSSAGAAQAYIVDSTYTEGSECWAGRGQDGRVYISYGSYAAGGEIRHELGHWVQAALHNFQQYNECLNYRYDGDNANPPSHGFSSCEYGYAAHKEAIATFIAVRSVTSNDTNAWFCQFGSGFNHDQCSLDVKNRAGDPNNDGINPETLWSIIGDRYATTASRCAISDSFCKCGGAGEPVCTDQTFRNNNGFRNEVQPARLYWDALDTNNEGSDDVDLSMGGIISAFLAMPSGTANNQFNEPGTSAAACLPEQANVKDYANAIDAYIRTITPVSPPTLAAERTLNCVSTGIP